MDKLTFEIDDFWCNPDCTSIQFFNITIGSNDLMRIDQMRSRVENTPDIFAAKMWFKDTQVYAFESKDDDDGYRLECEHFIIYKDKYCIQASGKYSGETYHVDITQKINDKIGL